MQDPASGSQIYQNIIANNNLINHDEMGGIEVLCDGATDVLIHNNTFYQNYRGDLVQRTNCNSSTFSWFNNISANPHNYHLYAPWEDSTFGGMTYADYNTYYNDVSWKYQTTINNTLADWKTTCESFLVGCDANSITTDPGFINASSNFNEPSDFKRTVYSENGRGGIYPSVMGAYVTGNEIIGYLSSISADVTPPSMPLGLSVQ